MDDGLADILDICLKQLVAGTSIEDCLVAFPAQRAQLEPPLRAAAELTQLPHPAMPPQARARLEATLLASAAARRAARPSAQLSWWRLGPSAILAGVLRACGYGGPLSVPWLRLGVAVVALVLALILGTGAYAATRAIVSLVLPPAPTPTLAPTATLQPTPAPFTLDGSVEQIDQEAWVVDGATILIDGRTQISATIAVGARVRIVGVIRADGMRLAYQIGTLTAPTPSPLALPTPSPLPSPSPFIPPTILPVPTATQPPVPIDVPPQGGDDNGPDKDHQCQGLQLGREEKKCNPKDKGKNDGKGQGGDRNDDKGKKKDNKRGKPGK